MKNALNVIAAALKRFTCKTCEGVGQVYVNTTEFQPHDTLCPTCKGAGIVFPDVAEERALDALFNRAMSTTINVEDNTIAEVEAEVQAVCDGILAI